jgi:hypothetical protein
MDRRSRFFNRKLKLAMVTSDLEVTRDCRDGIETTMTSNDKRSSYLALVPTHLCLLERMRMPIHYHTHVVLHYSSTSAQQIPVQPMARSY